MPSPRGSFASSTGGGGRYESISTGSRYGGGRTEPCRMCRQGSVSDRQRQRAASADRDQRLTGRGLGAARTGASRCQACAPGLRLTALAAPAIGFTGVSGTASMPVREHCGPDGHRNAWGRCPTDCDTARPNGTAIFGALAFGPFIEHRRAGLGSIAAGPFAPCGFYWRVGPRVSRSSAPGPAR